MKILISIKKKWLQHRADKYTRKYQETLSESYHYLNLSIKHYDYALFLREKSSYLENSEFSLNLTLSKDYLLESKKFKQFSDIYFDKKSDLEKEIELLNCFRA